jgi:hypothetical protein
VKVRWTRSGAGRAAGSRRVVVTKARRLTPAQPAACMRRATRLRPMWRPSAASSAWMRGAPYVPLDRSWIVRIRSRNAWSAWARAERTGIATRSTRWRRRAARGTRWPRRAYPGAPSRTRIPGWKRVGLPGEPGRGVSEDVPLFAQRVDLAAQATHFVPLLGRQPVRPPAVIAVGLLEPGPDRLSRRLELPAERFRRAPGARQLDEPRPEVRGIRWSGSRHRRHPPPPQGYGVHESGSTRDGIAPGRDSPPHGGIAARTSADRANRR